MNPYLLVIAPENGEIYTGTYSEKAAPYPADPHEPINSVISEALMIFIWIIIAALIGLLARRKANKKPKERQ